MEICSKGLLLHFLCSSLGVIASFYSGPCHDEKGRLSYGHSTEKQEKGFGRGGRLWNQPQVHKKDMKLSCSLVMSTSYLRRLVGARREPGWERWWRAKQTIPGLLHKAISSCSRFSSVLTSFLAGPHRMLPTALCQCSSCLRLASRR